MEESMGWTLTIKPLLDLSHFSLLKMKSSSLLIAVLLNSLMSVSMKVDRNERFESKQNADGQCCIAGTGQIFCQIKSQQQAFSTCLYIKQILQNI